MTAAASAMEAPSEAPPAPVFKQPQPINPNSLPFFSRISEDILVNVFSRLEQDPRDLARLACVCRRFTNLIKSSWKHQCMKVVPTIVSELMHSTSHHDLLGEPPCGWGSLQKLLVCCPGLRHAGVLLESWDFGLEREIGKSEDYELVKMPNPGSEIIVYPGPDVAKDVKQDSTATADTNVESRATTSGALTIYGNFDGNLEVVPGAGDSGLTALVKRKKTKESAVMGFEGPVKQMKTGGLHYHSKMMKDSKIVGSYSRPSSGEERDIFRSQQPLERQQPREKFADENSGRIRVAVDTAVNNDDPHLANGTWSLTREQGSKLLAKRFRDDTLYICDWPGCVHRGEKRPYKLLRGIFKNFKQSHVWRNLKDQRARRSDIPCAFCASLNTYDMASTFCLRNAFEYHDDGEPVVRAYVCENGHVAGAWTDPPLNNM